LTSGYGVAYTKRVREHNIAERRHLSNSSSSKEAGVILFQVPSDDRRGLLKWFKLHRREYGGEAWFGGAEQAIRDGDPDRAWSIVTAASVRSHAAALSNAAPPEERAAPAQESGTFVNETRVLLLDVAAGDHASLVHWLKQQQLKYGDTVWFSLVQEAIQKQDWGRAWRLAAHVSILSYSEAYLNAKTTEEAALALASGEAPGAASPEFRRSLEGEPHGGGRPGGTERYRPERSVRRSMLRTFGALVWVVAATLLSAFAVLAWPTAYRYDRVTVGDGWSFPVRINRLTGTPEALLPHVFAGEEEYRVSWAAHAEARLPGHLLAKLRDAAGLSGDNGSDEIYNGTGWTITKVRWEVTSRRASAPATRWYDQRVFIQPNTRALITYPFGPFGEGASVELTDAWGFEIEPMP